MFKWIPFFGMWYVLLVHPLDKDSEFSMGKIEKVIWNLYHGILSIGFLVLLIMDLTTK